MKSFPLALLSLCLVSTVGFAQSPVGSWKRISVSSIAADGSKTENHADLVKAMPCAADIIYGFTADGKMQINSDPCPPAMMKSIRKGTGNSRWKMTGNTLIATMIGSSLPPQNYKIHFQGDKMIWTYLFADNPKSPNPLKERSSIVVYQRAK